MAAAWHKVADQADRNAKCHLVYEPPFLTMNQPSQPIARQQQQQPQQDKKE